MEKPETSNVTAITENRSLLLLKATVLQNLAAASLLYSKECSQEFLEMWLTIMIQKNENPRAIARSFQKYFETGKFFPTPAHILEIIQEQSRVDTIPYPDGLEQKRKADRGEL